MYSMQKDYFMMFVPTFALVCYKNVYSHTASLLHVLAFFGCHQGCIWQGQEKHNIGQLWHWCACHVVTYHCALVREVTILFKNTNLKITFHTSNTIFHIFHSVHCS
jgi:hypothetical protein